MSDRGEELARQPESNDSNERPLNSAEEVIQDRSRDIFLIADRVLNGNEEQKIDIYDGGIRMALSICREGEDISVDWVIDETQNGVSEERRILLGKGQLKDFTVSGQRLVEAGVEDSNQQRSYLLNSGLYRGVMALRTNLRDVLVGRSVSSNGDGEGAEVKKLLEEESGRENERLAAELKLSRPE